MSGSAELLLLGPLTYNEHISFLSPARLLVARIWM